MDMGLGAGAGYQGPVFSATATDVPTSGGYGDAGYGQMAFGPGGVADGGMGKHQAHATTFGIISFVLLVVYWWTLPR